MENLKELGYYKRLIVSTFFCLPRKLYFGIRLDKVWYTLDIKLVVIVALLTPIISCQTIS